MGVFSKILGEGISKPIEAVGRIIDDVWDSEEELMTKQAVLKKIENSPYLAAMQIALKEAGSSDKWTSRARPMILYSFCIIMIVDRAAMPLGWWVLQVFHDTAIPPPPSLVSTDALMTIVSGVLGTSWIIGRTTEKIKDRE